MKQKLYKTDEIGLHYELQGDGRGIYDIVYGDWSDKNKLDLFLPSIEKESYPVVVFVHGGGFCQSDKSHHLSNILNCLQYGYAVASVNYRLDDEAVYEGSRSDVVAALNCIAHQPKIDGQRMILWGETHGALLADDICVTQSEGQDYHLVGMISFYAPNDMAALAEYKKKVNMPVIIRGVDNDTHIFGCDGEKMLSEMKRLDFVPKISGKEPPFFLLHGQLDDTIPVSQSLRLDKALTEKGVPHELYIVPDGKHGIDHYMNQRDNEKVCDFIDGILNQ